MPSLTLTFEQVRTLVFDVLKNHPTGQHALIVSEVLHRMFGSNPLQRLEPPRVEDPDYRRIEEMVRQIMWRLLIDGVIVFGVDANNNSWPFYKVTEYGKRVVETGAIQPYDPDRFVAYFDQQCSSPDAIVREYFVEAVTCFNGDCIRASVIMLGASSERMILLLKDSTASSIGDQTIRDKFLKDCRTRSARHSAPCTVGSSMQLVRTSSRARTTKRSRPHFRWCSTSFGDRETMQATRWYQLRSTATQRS